MITNLFKPTHLLLLLIIVLIIFGPSKLPQIGSTMGKAIRDFKKSVSEPEEEQSVTKSASASGEQK